LYHREWNKQNKDKISAYQKNYNKKNPEKIKEIIKNYRANMTEQQKEKVKEKARTRSWVKYNFDAEHREKHLQACKERYKKDPKKYNEMCRKCAQKYRDNPEIREKQKQYSALYRTDPIMVFFGV